MEFLIVPKLRVASAPKTVEPTPKPDQSLAQRLRGVDFGNYYALIIGNNAYQRLPSLDTAINDAETAERILQQKYGFETTLLKNATRYDILSALNELREKLTDRDNLLIYYAGHGELDEVNLRGHWLPVDAEPDSSANWISNIAVSDILNVMSAKHVLVVADSCYSGAMTRSSLARLQAGMSVDAMTKWLKVMTKTRSRTVLTSGGLKPVLDRAAGSNHSVFALAFLDTLRRNDTILEGYTLFRDVADRVQAAAAQYGLEQIPEYAPIRYGGHEAGEFLFVPKDLRLSTGDLENLPAARRPLAAR